MGTLRYAPEIRPEGRSRAPGPWVVPPPRSQSPSVTPCRSAPPRWAARTASRRPPRSEAKPRERFKNSRHTRGGINNVPSCPQRQNDLPSSITHAQASLTRGSFLRVLSIARLHSVPNTHTHTHTHTRARAHTTTRAHAHPAHAPAR